MDVGYDLSERYEALSYPLGSVVNIMLHPLIGFFF
jgi:hypothetical protein